MRTLPLLTITALAFTTLAGIPNSALALGVDAEAVVVLTDAPMGEMYLEEFETRLENAPGADPSLVNYDVVRGVPGDDPAAIWILPDAENLPEVIVTEQDGVFEVSMTVDSSPVEAMSLARGGGASDGAMSRAGTLSWSAPTCFARYTTTYGWFDRCTQWGVVTSDGDTARDHWVFKYYGTCKSNSTYYVQTCGLSSVKSSTSSTLYWEDWAPKSDSSGGCRSVSIGVSVFGISASGSYQGCDTVDITKYEPAGQFANTFRTPSVYMSERSVQYQISLGVPQGGVPRLVTNASMTGYLKIG